MIRPPGDRQVVGALPAVRRSTWGSSAREGAVIRGGTVNAPHNSAQAPAWRKRTAAVFAAVGALIFSSGIVMLSAPAANAAGKIGVCHRTGGDHHPYVFQRVAANSTAIQAHRDHQSQRGTNPGRQVLEVRRDVERHRARRRCFKPDYIQGDSGVPACRPTSTRSAPGACRVSTVRGGSEDPTVLPLAAPTFEANAACAVAGWVDEPASPGRGTPSMAARPGQPSRLAITPSPRLCCDPVGTKFEAPLRLDGPPARPRTSRRPWSLGQPPTRAPRRTRSPRSTARPSVAAWTYGSVTPR